MNIVFALSTTTVAAGDGRHVIINQGEHWPASDPVVKAYPGLFIADPRYGLRISTPLKEDEDAGKPETPVEQATKAPGEKRPTRRA